MEEVKYLYDIEYRLDDRYGEEDYTDEVSTKKEVRKQLRELQNEYGVRVVNVIIKRWRYIDGWCDEWVNVWDYSTDKNGTAIKTH